MADPFALTEDGTPKDPAAFQKALREDPVKMEALEKEPEVAAVVLGEDVNAFTELIKSIYQARSCLWSHKVSHGAGKGATGESGTPEGDGPLWLVLRPPPLPLLCCQLWPFLAPGQAFNARNFFPTVQHLI